jgi:hypothetical protein
LVAEDDHVEITPLRHHGHETRYLAACDVRLERVDQCSSHATSLAFATPAPGEIRPDGPASW